MEAPDLLTRSRSDAEALVRHSVRMTIGEAMTRAGLRSAMRSHTPDSYRQDVLKDGVSELAMLAAIA